MVQGNVESSYGDVYIGIPLRRTNVGEKSHY